MYHDYYCYPRYVYSQRPYRRTGLSGLNILHIDRYTHMYDRTSVNGADTGRCCLTWYRLQSLGLIQVLPSPADWKWSCCSFNTITLPLGARHSTSTSSPTTSCMSPFPSAGTTVSIPCKNNSATENSSTVVDCIYMKRTCRRQHMVPSM